MSKWFEIDIVITMTLGLKNKLNVEKYWDFNTQEYQSVNFHSVAEFYFSKPSYILPRMKCSCISGQRSRHDWHDCFHSRSIREQRDLIAIFALIK